VSQAGAAFVAAALQDSPASSRCHALEETVFFCAVALLWLVGSFWHCKISLDLFVIQKYTMPTDVWPVGASPVLLP